MVAILLVPKDAPLAEETVEQITAYLAKFGIQRVHPRGAKILMYYSEKGVLTNPDAMAEALLGISSGIEVTIRTGEMR